MALNIITMLIIQKINPWFFPLVNLTHFQASPSQGTVAALGSSHLFTDTQGQAAHLSLLYL